MTLGRKSQTGIVIPVPQASILAAATSSRAVVEGESFSFVSSGGGSLKSKPLVDGTVLSLPLPVALSATQIPLVIASLGVVDIPKSLDPRGVFIFPTSDGESYSGKTYEEVISEHDEDGRFLIRGTSALDSFLWKPPSTEAAAPSSPDSAAEPTATPSRGVPTEDETSGDDASTSPPVVTPEARAQEALFASLLGLDSPDDLATLQDLMDKNLSTLQESASSPPDVQESLRYLDQPLAGHESLIDQFAELLSTCPQPPEDIASQLIPPFAPPAPQQDPE